MAGGAGRSRGSGLRGTVPNGADWARPLVLCGTWLSFRARDDRLIAKTNLIDAYDDLMGFCERHLPDPFVLEDNARVSVRGIVCRELITNLLIHREFASPFPAKITIDREGLHTENASRMFFKGAITQTSLTSSVF